MSIFDLAHLITESTGFATTTHTEGHAAGVIVTDRAAIYWNHLKDEWNMRLIKPSNSDGKIYLRGTDHLILLAICALLKS